MKHKWPKFGRYLPLSTGHGAHFPVHFPGGNWLVILPTLLIVGLALVLTEGTSAAHAPASPSRVLLSKVLFQEQHPLCQDCHPDEYAAWKDSPHAKATLDPAFREQWAKSHNQQACLACHTTGFDTGNSHFLSEGVSCEACHGPYKKGHPAAATMQLPMNSGTCRMCHQKTFEEWKQGKHASEHIDCFDCHMAHTQGLRTGSEEKLCSACHPQVQDEFIHSTHGIQGLACTSCHMAKEKGPVGVSNMQDAARNHSFKVASDVCTNCHGKTIHTSNTVPELQQVVSELDTHQLQAQANRVPELEQQVNDFQKRIAALRNISVISMGLSLALGGFLGLVVGLVGISLWRGRHGNESAENDR